MRSSRSSRRFPTRRCARAPRRSGSSSRTALASTTSWFPPSPPCARAPSARSASVIVHGLSDDERRQQYACDVTYGTNNELGFDYLRDNMKYRLEDMVQRGHVYAIVDEVDSILVDEARTPLIISGPLDDRSDFYNTIDTFFPKLDKTDYEVDEKQRTVTLTEAGMEKIETLLRDADLLKSDHLYDVENVSTVH